MQAGFLGRRRDLLRELFIGEVVDARVSHEGLVDTLTLVFRERTPAGAYSSVDIFVHRTVGYLELTRRERCRAPRRRRS